MEGASGTVYGHYNDRVRRYLGSIALSTLMATLMVAALACAAAAAAPCHLDPAIAAARRGDLDAAFILAQRATAAPAPGQAPASDCIAVRELLRQRATLAHLESAHRLVLARQPGPAAVEFRAALAIEPHNADARQGLAALYPNAAPTPLAPTATELRVRRAAAPVVIQPTAGVHTFHQRAPLHALIGSVSAAYGLHAYVADSVPNLPVPFDVGDASFAEAMAGLHGVAGVDWIPLDPHTLYFTLASQAGQIAPLATRTFYVPGAASTGASAVALTQIAGVLRSLLGLTHITPDAAAGALTIRATAGQLDAAERLLLDLSRPAGEVVLEIKILDISSNVARQLGINDPDQFTMFALGPLLAQLQNNNNLQQDILQLFEQGGLNAVLNSGTLTPQQLSQFQSTISPLLQNPFVTFGGGTTLMALSVPNLSANLSVVNSHVRTVETALVRADNGHAAELNIGQSYPIINASFSPVSLSSAISAVIGNGSFVQPFPSFTYENLGLDAKLTPELGPDGTLNLSADLTIKALTGASNNNIPILSNRHVVTSLSLRDNQPVMIAGLLTRQQMTAIAGLPGLSQLPGLGRLFSDSTGQSQDEQLVLMITPHVVELPPQQAAAIWLPASFAPMGALPALAPPPVPRSLVPAAPRLPFGAAPAGPRGVRPNPPPNSPPNTPPAGAAAPR